MLWPLWDDDSPVAVDGVEVSTVCLGADGVGPNGALLMLRASRPSGPSSGGATAPGTRRERKAVVRVSVGDARWRREGEWHDGTAVPGVSYGYCPEGQHAASRALAAAVQSSLVGDAAESVRVGDGDEVPPDDDDDAERAPCQEIARRCVAEPSGSGGGLALARIALRVGGDLVLRFYFRPVVSWTDCGGREMAFPLATIALVCDNGEHDESAAYPRFCNGEHSQQWRDVHDCRLTDAEALARSGIRPERARSATIAAVGVAEHIAAAFGVPLDGQLHAAADGVWQLIAEAWPEAEAEAGGRRGRRRGATTTVAAAARGPSVGDAGGA